MSRGGIEEGRDPTQWRPPLIAFVALCVLAGIGAGVGWLLLRRRLGPDERTRQGNVPVPVFALIMGVLVGGIAVTFWAAQAVADDALAALTSAACIAVTLTAFGALLFRSTERARRPRSG